MSLSGQTSSARIPSLCFMEALKSVEHLLIVLAPGCLAVI